MSIKIAMSGIRLFLGDINFHKRTMASKQDQIYVSAKKKTDKLFPTQKMIWKVDSLNDNKLIKVNFEHIWRNSIMNPIHFFPKSFMFIRINTRANNTQMLPLQHDPKVITSVNKEISEYFPS
jgi:hypothetical protein